MEEKRTFGERLADTQEEHIKAFSQGVEAGEVVNAWGPEYMRRLDTAIKNHAFMREKFYVHVISKHIDFQPNRGMKIIFVVRRTAPMMEETTDLWSYDPKTGTRALEWSLPHRHEMTNFLLSPQLYSKKLLDDIRAYLHI